MTGTFSFITAFEDVSLTEDVLVLSAKHAEAAG